MNTFPPLPYSFHEPIPVGEVISERDAMQIDVITYTAEESTKAARLLIELAEAMCPGFTDECRRLRWAKGVAGMDDQGSFCDVRMACK